MAPFRPLLTKDAVLQWLPEHEHAFVEAKSHLSTVIIILGVNIKTILATDASRLKGLGFVLLQLVNGVWRAVQAGSRFLTPTKSRYVMTELEALAELCSSATCTFSDYTTLNRWPATTKNFQTPTDRPSAFSSYRVHPLWMVWLTSRSKRPC